MKTKLLALLFMAFAFTQAQVSTMRINDIKLGMSKTEVEKLIGKKIIIKLSEYNYPEDAVNIVHKGIAYSIFLITMVRKPLTSPILRVKIHH